MSDDIAVSVQNVYKDFKLPHEKITSIKSAFTGVLKGGSRTSYEQQHALKSISFDVKKGEFFGIVGRNGSGKSTLLKIIAQIYQPTKGSIRVNGKLVPFIELGVGFNPELTGRENVYLNGAILGFTKEKIDENYKNIVEFAELEEFMDQKLKNYSSGMQVRLAFACATKAEAEILLVDEVLAVGDSDFQRKCFSFFKDLKRRHKTVIFVTHDMDAVREYCDRALLIEDSKVVLEGSAATVAAEYTKMFNSQTKVADSGNVEGSRWGGGQIKYTKIKIPKILKDEVNLDFSVTAKATQNISSPNFGITIKNASHVNILGTNTKIIERKIAKISAGEEITLHWSIPNIFNDGAHFIDLAIVYDNNHQVADWWEEAAVFQAIKNKRTPYLVNPIISCDIEEG